MFDFNAKLGHWPYRPVRGLDALLRAMDALGVARAVVSSLSAVHFLDPQDGNEALVRCCAAHRDRLVPFAVLRPNFAGWAADLATCLDERGMKGIVLHPNYHGVALTDPALGPLMDEAARRGVPVCVQAALEDVRRQFHPARVDDVPAPAIGALAKACPDTTVVALGLKFGQPEQMGNPLPANLFFDTSNYETLGDLEHAADRFGAEKILLGSGFPLFNPRANVDKLRCADIADTARDAIAEGNARRILGLWGS